MVTVSTAKVMTGNHAVSYGALLSRVQVIAAYPITPQTQVVELLSEFVASGRLAARFINVESEHSAMAACIGAASVGARAFTATSSQGLALMHEMLHWASGARLPIVMANINRALAPPWSIWTDQTDSLAQRDTGWMQIYVESSQEALDSIILGYKVSERVLLPTMVVLDAFLLSHTAEPVEVYDQGRVDEFLPPFSAPHRLKPGVPQALGGLADPGLYFEFRVKLEEAMEAAREAIVEEGERFGKLFGRHYNLLDGEHTEDAETVIVTSGTLSGTARAAIRELRDRGRKVGLVRIRVFRPFPFAEVRRVLQGRRRVAVLDRNLSPGHHGIFFEEVKSALYPASSRPLVVGYVLGLGGRDIRPEDIHAIVEDLEKRREAPEIVWWGVRR